MIDDPAPGENLLRAGVAQRAQHFPRDREPDIARDPGQAEVGDPELSAEVQQQVPRLDVAMHDSPLVGVLKRQRRLSTQPGHALEVPEVVCSSLARDRRRRGHCRSLCRRRGAFNGRVGGGRTVTPLVAQGTQLSDQGGKALSVDELHGVIVHAALAADGVYRHDLLVLHLGRREGLGLEALEAPGIDGRSEREDLERDPPLQRDLHGLVDDPHAAPAHLAQEAKVAELAEARGGLIRLVAGARERPASVGARRGAGVP